jgi:murein DD-endopeptidase MepM/ murein hydrolase activator NlpD
MLAAALSFVSLAGIGVYYTYSITKAEIAYQEVKAQNKKLVSTLNSLKELVENEAEAVEEISRLETDLSLHYGISPTAEEIKKLSIGGRASLSDKARMLLGSPLEKSIAVIEEDISSNKRQVDFLKTRLESIREEAERQNNYFAEKPSTWPAIGRVTSEFGSRFHPVLGGSLFHEGIDIANSMWTTIKAPADGIVVHCDYRGGYGLTLEIEHRRSGYSTRYAHLADSKVKVGDRVKRGDIIASLGNSGLSTGPHLHYEVRRGGSLQNPRHYLISSEMNVIID